MVALGGGGPVTDGALVLLLEQVLCQINASCAQQPHKGREPDSDSFKGGATIGEEIMDKDRVVGLAKQIKGAVKQVVGKAVGDVKRESEGAGDKVEGKVQNAVGGLKDKLKGK
jgi:uncharacterized protein YjbJ (UPF0337 family)